MSDVETGQPEVGQSECRHHIPDAKETDLRVGLDDDVGPGLADLTLLNQMAEVQRGRSPSAESHDIDDVIAFGPLVAEMIVGFVQAGQDAQAERAAQHPADEVKSRADASDVEVPEGCVPIVGFEKPDDVGVLVAAFIVLAVVTVSIILGAAQVLSR